MRHFLVQQDLTKMKLQGRRLKLSTYQRQQIIGKIAYHVVDVLQLADKVGTYAQQFLTGEAQEVGLCLSAQLQRRAVKMQSEFNKSMQHMDPIEDLHRFVIGISPALCCSCLHGRSSVLALLEQPPWTFLDDEYQPQMDDSGYLTHQQHVNTK